MNHSVRLQKNWSQGGALARRDASLLDHAREHRDQRLHRIGPAIDDTCSAVFRLVRFAANCVTMVHQGVRWRNGSALNVEGIVSAVDVGLISRAVRLSAEERAAVPPVRQAMALGHGARGRSLYLGVHCVSIEDMDQAEGRAIIDRLMAFATQERFV